MEFLEQTFLALAYAAAIGFLVSGLDDRHRGHSLQQFGHDAPAIRVEMGDDDKSHPALLGNLSQEMLNGFQTACRGANANDREARREVVFPGCIFGIGFPGLSCAAIRRRGCSCQSWC